MSGHSKWSTIKRKKAATDAKRGKLFTRLLKEIQVAARMGGGSIDGNPRLRSAVQAARAQSVPGDTIEKAIKRGTGDLEGVQYEEITYEGYGPGGVAILVTALTDNKTRTVAEVRHAFSRNNGNLASSNSVAYLFKERGVLNLPKSSIPEEKVFEIALDAGASDIQDDGDVWEIVTEASEFEAVKEALKNAGADPQGEIQLQADTNVRVTGKDAENTVKLLEILDELDDVQKVVANFDMDQAEFERLSS